MSRPMYRRGREYRPAGEEVGFVLLGTLLAVELGLSMLLAVRLLGWW